jgi:hypothetical protein
MACETGLAAMRRLEADSVLRCAVADPANAVSRAERCSESSNCKVDCWQEQCSSKGMLMGSESRAYRHAGIHHTHCLQAIHMLQHFLTSLHGV